MDKTELARAYDESLRNVDGSRAEQLRKIGEDPHADLSLLSPQERHVVESYRRLAAASGIEFGDGNFHHPV